MRSFLFRDPGICAPLESWSWKSHPPSYSLVLNMTSLLPVFSFKGQMYSL